jgi:hypothetical protein
MQLTIAPGALQNLRSLQTEKKFVEEHLYPGAPDEKTRLRCESWINDLLERLLLNIEQNPRKDFVMSEFIEALVNFGDEDTEEREQACGYLEQIMTIVGIESSDGKLNQWLYGFDPNQ